MEPYEIEYGSKKDVHSPPDLPAGRGMDRGRPGREVESRLDHGE